VSKISLAEFGHRSLITYGLSGDGESIVKMKHDRDDGDEATYDSHEDCDVVNLQ
jgi:hypothetical protein